MPHPFRRTVLSYIFCFCPLLDVSLTGDQQRSVPGLMTNVVSNERAFGRQWPDYNSLFHFTSSAINITHTQWEAATHRPRVCVSLKF